MKRGAAEKNVSGWIIFNKTIIYIKGILWEIYECVSELLSHLGRMFGAGFRPQWVKKVTKSGIICLTILFGGMPLVPSCDFVHMVTSKNDTSNHQKSIPKTSTPQNKNSELRRFQVEVSIVQVCLIIGNFCSSGND